MKKGILFLGALALSLSLSAATETVKFPGWTSKNVKALESYAQSVSEKTPAHAIQIKVLIQTTSQTLSFDQIKSNIFEGMKANSTLASKKDEELQASALFYACQIVYLSRKADLYLEAYKQGKASKSEVVNQYANWFLTVSDLNLSASEFYSTITEALFSSFNLSFCERALPSMISAMEKAQIPADQAKKDLKKINRAWSMKLVKNKSWEPVVAQLRTVLELL